MKPIPPAKPAQGLMGIRRERGKVIRPVTAPPAHPQKPNFYPIELPCRTCQMNIAWSKNSEIGIRKFKGRSCC